MYVKFEVRSCDCFGAISI